MKTLEELYPGLCAGRVVDVQVLPPRCVKALASCGVVVGVIITSVDSAPRMIILVPEQESAAY